MLRDEGVLDLAGRFGEFADVCSRFSRNLVRGTPEFARLTRSQNVHLNLRIAKTMFSKWSVDIVSLLYTNREVGFQEMRKALGDITPRVLSHKLGRLQRMGLIQREVLPTKPPRVQYSLTEKGHRAAKLGEPLFLYLRLVAGVVVEVPAEPRKRVRRRGRTAAKESRRRIAPSRPGSEAGDTPIQAARVSSFSPPPIGTLPHREE